MALCHVVHRIQNTAVAVRIRYLSETIVSGFLFPLSSMKPCAHHKTARSHSQLMKYCSSPMLQTASFLNVTAVKVKGDRKKSAHGGIGGR